MSLCIYVDTYIYIDIEIYLYTYMYIDIYIYTLRIQVPHFQSDNHGSGEGPFPGSSKPFGQYFSPAPSFRKAIITASRDIAGRSTFTHQLKCVIYLVKSLRTAMAGLARWQQFAKYDSVCFSPHYQRHHSWIDGIIVSSIFKHRAIES